MTCYITQKQDPQRADTVNTNNHEYMTKFYNTLRNLNLSKTDIVIFHDGLSDEFQELYPVIKFEFFEWDEYTRRHFLSTNDQRYVLYMKYIQRGNYKDIYDYVLMTDLHDVAFGKDPFVFMRQTPDMNIFSGSEARRSEWAGWCSHRIEVCYQSQSHKADRFWTKPEAQPLNAGIFGGKVETV
eukprot:UN32267